MAFRYGFLLLFACGTNAYFSYQPEQVHLSYGDTVRDYIVTWSTFNKTAESVVQYGIHSMDLEAKGDSVAFVDGGKLKRIQYIHRVILKNLQPGSEYVYHVGSYLGWSAEFWFKTPPSDDEWIPHLAIFGDMGNENAQSLVRLQQETQAGLYDAILHVGDFAYDMDTEEAKVGDEFMRQIEPVAAYLPYMVCPGNHEEKYNFSNYKNRFSMPGELESLLYSFDMGPVHFIAINTEAYYFLNYGFKQLVYQYDWLEEDLKKANQNRDKTPWIIVYGHRPMYCSNNDSTDCTHHETLTRVGLPLVHWFGLEELFYKQGVDVEIWAHQHSYERLWPIYDYNVYNGSYEEPYVNPEAPVHIITGSAGCKEGKDTFKHVLPNWSAFRSTDYGYTRLKAYNSTHLHFEQVSDDKKGQIIDQFYLVKNRHGPYPERVHRGKSTPKKHEKNEL